MSKPVFSVTDAMDLIEADGAQEVDEEAYKGEIHTSYVVPFEGKMYKFTISRTHDHGWEKSFFINDPVEVVKKTETRVIETWVRVNPPVPKAAAKVKATVLKDENGKAVWPFPNRDNTQ